MFNGPCVGPSFFARLWWVINRVQPATIWRTSETPVEAFSRPCRPLGCPSLRKRAVGPLWPSGCGCLSGKGVKGCTGSRMRSAGRSPSTERVRMQAKRTLDSLGTTPRSRHGCRGFQGRRPSPCTLDDRGRLAPLAGRGAGGSGWGPLSAPFGGLDLSFGCLALRWSSCHGLGDAGREREARAEGRRPGGAGGGLAPQEAARPSLSTSVRGRGALKNL